MGVPVGLSMALAQNIYALEHFSSLPEGEKRAIVERARGISSHDEMQSYVNNLIKH